MNWVTRHPPRCLWCGTRMRRGDQAHWALGTNLRIWGIVHAAHANPWRQEAGLPEYHIQPATLTAGEAHRRAWATAETSRREKPEWLAMTLFVEMATDRRGKAKTNTTALPTDQVRTAQEWATNMDIQYRQRFRKYRTIFALTRDAQPPRVRGG